VTEHSDIFIIGGGVNGTGIARDAAGRGLSVVLAEMNDLASATSSASTKLFHGGLRYLEYLEFRLVREALAERDILLSTMPHISRAMRFVLPLDPDMRFDTATPVSRLVPFFRGRRPDVMIRAGLMIYDRLAGSHSLPGTSRYRLRGRAEGVPLSPRLSRAFEYSDGWVDDARLVVLNARDAGDHGAEILTRTKVSTILRKSDHWHLTLTDTTTGAITIKTTRCLVNAAGPWAGALAQDVAPTPGRLRLVKGSHIVTRRLFEHDKSYFLQGPDGRIIFMIPYEGDFTLIGTTDLDHASPDQPPVISGEERAYLCEMASRYLAQPITAEDIVWSFSGIRPLYDDGASSASAASRDYHLEQSDGEPPVVHVFGGKITTHRKLAEAVLDKLAGHIPIGTPWTATAALPGGDFNGATPSEMVKKLRKRFPFLGHAWATRLIHAYGTDAWSVLGKADSALALGRYFGADLTEAELRWMCKSEFARTSEDVLWRRSKLGLKLTRAEQDALADWMAAHMQERGTNGTYPRD